MRRPKMREIQSDDVQAGVSEREAAPSLALMTRPPSDPFERARIGNDIWVGIFVRFRSALLERDRILWDSLPADPSKSPEHLQILHRFDDFVLCQFAEFGWRLLMSENALQRISEWEKHNPVLLERLGKELALRSKVLRGEKQAPFPEDFAEFAEKAMDELQILLRRQKDEFGSKRVVTCDKISAWMRGEIESRSKEFFYLKGNLEQLCGFINTLPRFNHEAAQVLIQGQMRAYGFFTLWYSTCTNRSLKDVKNQLARLRNKR